MIRVCALTAGPNIPSARFRVGQYANRLTPWNVDLVHHAPVISGYPPPQGWMRPFWLAAAVSGRVPDIVRTHSYDVTLLQRELVSTLVTLEGWTARPRLFDVDDAIWLLPRGRFAGRLAKRCDAVICGNTYLADYFGRHCQTIHVLPTAVDTERFKPSRERRSGRRILGWTGSRAGFSQLTLIERALVEVLRQREDVVLRVVADIAPRLSIIPPGRWEFVPWSAATEVESIQAMDIGLMPLADGEWERGKCAYKMLLYLACGIPAVASPVGMNREVLCRSDVGLSPVTDAEWVQAMLQLLDDEGDRQRRGDAGRALVESEYSVRAIAPRLGGILHEAGRS